MILFGNIIAARSAGALGTAGLSGDVGTEVIETVAGLHDPTLTHR